MEEEIEDKNKKGEKLIQTEESRDSGIELGRISENTENTIRENTGKKVSSLQTIFSIWNTMIGSTIISIPYNVYLAGIIPTIIFGLLYGFICYFTCSIVVKLGGKEEEFANVVFNYFSYSLGKNFGKFGRFLQITFNLMINIGATFVYFLIINQNLFPCICLLLGFFGIDLDADDITPYFSRFSLFYCALIICIVIFPLTILKEMRLLVKFNSYGIYFVSILLLFVIYTGISSLIKDTFHFEYKQNIEGDKNRYLLLFGENINRLSGTLSLGLFCHSVILPLLKNNRKPENNQRDLFLGYVCVTFTYIIIGIMGYIGFSGSEFSSTFHDNWFRFFKSDNYFILVLRLLNVIQLSSIFPILFFVVRQQLFSTFCESYINSKIHRVVFSLILFSLCIIVLYFFYDTLGDFISYLGASTALILVYTISPITNMIYYYMRHQTKKEVKLITNKMKSSISSEDQKPIFPGDLGEPVPLKPVKAFFFYLSMMLIVFLGIMTFVLQIVSVNFFKVKIQKN